jgi:hypothetical protein
MHQTRQFTKRRPQSPSINQQHPVEGLQVSKPTLARSGLAIQSNAPIHVTSSHRSSPVHHTNEVHEHEHKVHL